MTTALLLAVVLAGCSGTAPGGSSGTSSTNAGSTPGTAPNAQKGSSPAGGSGYLPVKKQQVAWGTSSAGGASNFIGQASATVIGRQVPELQVTALVTSGSTENLRRVHDGEFQFGQPTSDSAYYAYNGGREFQAPLTKVRFVINQWVSPENIITLERTGIKKMSDLKGKKIGSTPGWGATIFAPAILDAHGLKEKADYTITPLPTNDVMNALRDGQVDAVMVAFGFPVPAVSEVATTQKIRFISAEQSAVAELQKKHPYWFASTIPKGVYRGVDEDVLTVANNNILVASADVPEEVVYNVVKALIENMPDVAAIYPEGKNYTLQNAASNAVIPIHPGAERYYKEKGVLPAKK